MTSINWVQFQTVLAGNAATVILDMSLEKLIPIRGYDYFVTLTASLAAGVNTELTVELDHCVYNFVRYAGEIYYVGRINIVGRQIFCFYSPHPEFTLLIVNAIMSRFKGIDYETEVLRDPSWDNYCNFLFPDDVLAEQLREAMRQNQTNTNT